MMIASACFFGLMAIAIRFASHQQHPFEIAFFRSLFGALFALPLIWVRGRTLLVTDKLGFYVARCVIGMLGMMAGFWAIVHLPLAQAIALSYSSPLFVTIGAVLFLGEIVRARRWSAVAAGFIGVLVIVHPNADGLAAGALVAVMAAALSGMTTVSIKFLSRSEPPDRIVLLTTLLWVPLSLPGALTVWRWPDAATWPWLVLSGFLGTGGHYFWTRALRLADASVLAPFSYMQLLIVTVLAWILFDERLDGYTAIGAAIIIGATLYIARREAKLARKHAVEAAAAEAEPQV
ncbi:MAG TPA: DMT family transporter [Rhodanobacteraceae bacterium]|nr:DMT family transporter [Rhodanobacteraceae bacterium]